MYFPRHSSSRLFVGFFFAVQLGPCFVKPLPLLKKASVRPFSCLLRAWLLMKSSIQISNTNLRQAITSTSAVTTIRTAVTEVHPLPPVVHHKMQKTILTEPHKEQVACNKFITFFRLSRPYCFRANISTLTFCYYFICPQNAVFASPQNSSSLPVRRLTASCPP